MGTTGENAAKGRRIPPDAAEGVQRILVGLRRNTTAQGVLLIDGAGGVVAEAGGATEGTLAAVLPVLGGEIAMTRRLGEGWDEEPVLSLHLYEGNGGQVYAAAAGDFPYLLVVLTRRQGLPPSGVTWLFVRRALQELRALLRPMQMEQEIGEILGVVGAEQGQGESERR